MWQTEVGGVRRYADGTELRVSYPWGLYESGRAVCSDGVVRRLARISRTADTFFSVPAAVKVKGRTVSGYVTVQTRKGYSVADDGDPARVEFHAYRYGVNADALPSEFSR